MICKLCGRSCPDKNGHTQYCPECASVVLIGRRTMKELDAATERNRNKDTKIAAAVECYKALSEDARFWIAVKCAFLKLALEEESIKRRGRTYSSTFGNVSALSLIYSMMKAGYL